MRPETGAWGAPGHARGASDPAGAGGHPAGGPGGSARCGRGPQSSGREKPGGLGSPRNSRQLGANGEGRHVIPPLGVAANILPRPRGGARGRRRQGRHCLEGQASWERPGWARPWGTGEGAPRSRRAVDRAAGEAREAGEAQRGRRGRRGQRGQRGQRGRQGPARPARAARPSPGSSRLRSAWRGIYGEVGLVPAVAFEVRRGSAQATGVPGASPGVGVRVVPTQPRPHSCRETVRPPCGQRSPSAHGSSCPSPGGRRLPHCRVQGRGLPEPAC